MTRPPPPSPLFPYTTLFRSDDDELARVPEELGAAHDPSSGMLRRTRGLLPRARRRRGHRALADRAPAARADRKSTRLNSSHTVISYAVFCLKKKKQNKRHSN